MTILKHWPKGGDNTAGVTTAGFEATAELFVESDDPEDTGLNVLQYLIANGYNYGDEYSVGNASDDSLILVQIDPPKLAPGSATLWIALLQYKTRTAETSAGGGGSPLDLRPKISTSNLSRSVLVESGVYLGGYELEWPVGQTRLITSSAGVPFSSGVEKDQHNQLLRITRNIDSVILSETAYPLDWINSEAVLISDRKTTVLIEKYQLKFLGWSTEQAVEQGVDFVRVTFEGEIKKDGWRKQLQDKGNLRDACDAPDGRYGTISSIAPGAAAQEAILTNSGLQVGADVPLNGQGQPLDKCDTDFFYGNWGIYDEIDIRVLPFFAGIAG